MEIRVSIEFWFLYTFVALFFLCGMVLVFYYRIVPAIRAISWFAPSGHHAVPAVQGTGARASIMSWYTWCEDNSVYSKSTRDYKAWIKGQCVAFIQLPVRLKASLVRLRPPKPSFKGFLTTPSGTALPLSYSTDTASPPPSRLSRFLHSLRVRLSFTYRGKQPDTRRFSGKTWLAYVKQSIGLEEPARKATVPIVPLSAISPLFTPIAQTPTLVNQWTAPAIRAPPRVHMQLRSSKRASWPVPPLKATPPPAGNPMYRVALKTGHGRRSSLPASWKVERPVAAESVADTDIAYAAVLFEDPREVSVPEVVKEARETWAVEPVIRREHAPVIVISLPTEESLVAEEIKPILTTSTPDSDSDASSSAESSTDGDDVSTIVAQLPELPSKPTIDETETGKKRVRRQQPVLGRVAIPVPSPKKAATETKKFKRHAEAQCPKAAGVTRPAMVKKAGVGRGVGRGAGVVGGVRAPKNVGWR
ncbi:hypothetical protein GLOTRDRAFT_130520 [Gloeophyllum trabeum ATCC 11539]|uniref:Uncharacterized protein n=1 Tax=Gloeophyllum trabeum (strain ATCC 11539 / FP-39264 / Madison 617) TaxID=670483 RepID=S7Q291_GLOTA|nr:uncharacterized protein GLOTRDRAFT_130520 [Gloeophyllum trabeum ATCC 11539]EPQ54136.1 hypothetical protein GLOTRDRAFT_130520 [Gloeophyllum trabeum ATCC 11539]